MTASARIRSRLRSTAYGRSAMFVSFGSASGQIEAFNINLLQAKGSLFATRPTLNTYAAKREDLLAMANDLFEVVGSGAVKIPINQKYALRDAAQVAPRSRRRAPPPARPSWCRKERAVGAATTRGAQSMRSLGLLGDAGLGVARLPRRPVPRACRLYSVAAHRRLNVADDDRPLTASWSRSFI